MLDPFLLIMVLEALSRRMRSGYPEKLFYADDLALVRRSFVGLKGKASSNGVNKAGNEC